MNNILIAAVFAIASYLIGSVNFSILISKAVSGKDIRESGSGNAGATNMLRTHGKKMGVLTLVLDIVKGLICVLAANIYVANAGGMDEGIAAALPYIAGVCVAIGHNFPLYFNFKGGKGVATTLGVVLMLDWKIGLIVAVGAIAVMAITRYVSLGSILGGAAFITAELVDMAVSGYWNVAKLICVVLLGGMLIARHHANIKRLLSGTENKLFEKKESR